MIINNVSPVKRPFKYNTREREVFEKWFEENISFDALSIVELTALHQAYQTYVAKCTGIVPLSKNKFSSLLRLHLAKEIEQLKVRTDSRTKVTFQGLFIKDQTCEPQATT